LQLAVLLAAIAGAACGPKYPNCKKDDHCAEKGEVCVDGTCQQCRDDGQCKAGEQCKGGRCAPKPECEGDSDCSGGKICRSGKCQVECTSKSDCGEGLKCAGGRCVDEMSCAGPSDCRSGMQCVSGRCQEMVANASRQVEGCKLDRVYFEFNESRLTSDAQASLKEAADCMKEKNAAITIEGHADERGTEEYNLALGEARASSVRKYLQNLGVPKSKLKILSKGEVEPIDEGHDEGAWAKNRRTEFIEK
jgi:peptidoglycan-associated lipoprotein